VDSSHTRRTGGSGLGLSISSSLIELHHGRIGIVSSAPNQGSTFFFTLPIEQPNEEIIDFNPST
jgi:signal transduction histidine kinase